MTNKYLADAIAEDPSGAVCGHCGGPNDSADDCGWFYCVYYKEPDISAMLALSKAGDWKGFQKIRETYGPSLPTCEACWNTAGRAHQSVHGVGER